MVMSSQSRRIGSTTNVDLSPLIDVFMPLVIDAFVPKAQRAQAQMQLAIKELARLYPTVSQFAPEEKEKFYSQFFPAFGVAHPSAIRGLFGAKPQSVIPLPEGATEFEGVTKMKSPLSGRRTEIPAGLQLPNRGPIRFQAKPLIQPEHRAELEAEAKRRFPDSVDEQEFWINQNIQHGMTGLPPGKDDLVAQAVRLMERGRGKYPSELMEKELRQRILPPGILGPYEEHLEDRELKELVKRATVEELASKGEARAETVKLAKIKEARYKEQFNQTMAFNKEKLASTIQQHKEMLKVKGLDRDTKLYIEMTKNRVQSELRAMEEHNKREMKIKENDPSYIPNIIQSSPILSQWDDLYSKVMSFGGRMSEGDTPGAPSEPPRVRRDKMTPKDQLIDDLWGGTK